MKKMLIITLLLGFGLGAFPYSFGQTAPPPAPSAPAASKPKPKSGAAKALKQAQRKQKQQQQASVRKQKKRTELTQKYGMTLSQIQQYEALQKGRQEKMVAVKKTSGLSKKECRQQIKAISKEFRASVNTILTPQQLSAMQDEATRHAKHFSNAVRPVLKNYRKERMAIKTKSTLPDRPEAFAQLDKKYETELTAVVGQERARSLMKKIENGHNAAKKDAKNYRLSYADAQRYSNMQEHAKQRKEKLNNTELTRKERTEQATLLKERDQGRVKNLLGDARFKQWNRDKNPNLDQKLKRSFNFSDQQIKQYREIENQAAVQSVKIKQGKGTKVEKLAKIAQIKAAADQKLQQMMTPAQYGKMVAQKDSQRRKTIQAHTVKRPKPKDNKQQPTK